MAEFTASAVQTVNPGETVVFDTTIYSGGCDGVNHRDGSGEFLIAGGPNIGGPCCCRRDTREVPTCYKANIAVPTDGTAGAFTLLNSFCNSSNSFFNCINFILSSLPKVSNCFIASVVDNIS